MIIEIFYTILVSLCLLYCLYFFIFSLFTFFGKEKLRDYEDDTKFGVLICARNEENVIGSLIDSLKDQTYKKSLYDIIVLTNNCTDNTADVAIKHGAKVVNVDVPVKSKGDVLNWLRDSFKDTEYDAYVIFDADNLVDKNFLKEMNKVYCNGHLVAQGCRDSKNSSDNWITSSYTLFYCFQNYFYNRARRNISKSALINGTGFMVDKKFFEDHFDAHTLTEDIEFSIVSVLNGQMVYYAEKAITYDEHVTTFSASWTQRKRWSKGNIQCLKRYFGRLFMGFIKRGDISNLDMILNCSAPIVQLVGLMLSTILFGISLTGTSIGIFNASIFSLALVVIGTINTYVLGILANIFVFILCKKEVSGNMWGILLFSFFMLTWIPISVHAMVSRSTVWVPIKHGN